MGTHFIDTGERDISQIRKVILRGLLLSQDLDDLLFQVPGLLDYRVTLDRIGTDRLVVDFVAVSTIAAMANIEEEIRRMLLQIPAINGSLANNKLIIATIRRIAAFAASHTVKRTILDQRPRGDKRKCNTYLIDS